MRFKLLPRNAGRSIHSLEDFVNRQSIESLLGMSALLKHLYHFNYIDKELYKIYNDIINNRFEVLMDGMQ